MTSEGPRRVRGPTRGGSGASALADLSAELLAQHDEAATLRAIVQGVDRFLPHAAGTTLLLWRAHAVPECVGASDPRSRALGTSQQELGEGPGLDALKQRDPVIADVRESGRTWPRWVPLALERGIAHVAAVRLATLDEVVGSLSVYGVDETFSVTGVTLVTAYAAHATNALLAIRRAEELDDAVHRRHRLGIAAGIVMAEGEIDLDRAQQLLSEVSAAHDWDLLATAEYVIRHRALPS